MIKYKEVILEDLAEKLAKKEITNIESRNENPNTFQSIVVKTKILQTIKEEVVKIESKLKKEIATKIKIEKEVVEDEGKYTTHVGNIKVVVSQESDKIKPKKSVEETVDVLVSEGFEEKDVLKKTINSTGIKNLIKGKDKDKKILGKVLQSKLFKFEPGNVRVLVK